MNPEDRLRRASNEIDRVTASITAPSMAELRSSARTQAIAVTIASAAAVIVLVGGAVVLFNGNGPTTLEPAAPGETTTTATPTTTATTEVTTTTAVVEATTTTVPAVSCSAGKATVPGTFDGIPEEVRTTVLDIVDAAQQCDYDGLEAIAGDGFTAAFGGGDPSELWTMEEEQGYQPMYWLLSVLNLPHGEIETEQGTLYVWPSAHAHQGSWETMPAGDLDALRALYTDEELQGFADFGGYVGYRVGIRANGDWSFFVAGD